jgi:FkbM family methyltransferase
MMHGAGTAASRAKLAYYLTWDLLHHAARVPVRPYSLDLHLSGLTVRVDAFASQLGAYVDIFQLDEYEHVKGFTSRPGDVVIDAGANVGFFSLKRAVSVGPAGRVYSFEPNPTAYEHLVRNVDGNRLRQVRCFCKALSDVEGTVGFSATVRGSSCGRIVHDSDAVSVQATTLDLLVEREGLDRIDLLKMDVEGHEPDVVRGGLGRALSITRRVVMESHRTRAAVWELLEPLGFRKELDDPDSTIVYFARPA